MLVTCTQKYCISNCLQAFNILASVIGEKSLESCCPLFFYLDTIGEAYRVCGGSSQFNSLPSLCLDQKEIGLWMKLMVQSSAPGKPFCGGAGSSGATRHLTTYKKSIDGSKECASLVQPVVCDISAPVAEAPIVLRDA